MLPFFTTLFTASVAIYQMISSTGEEMCIFFGSWVAMFAIDLTNQIIFVDCAFFISIMQVVLIRVAAASGRRQERSTASAQGEL